MSELNDALVLEPPGVALAEAEPAAEHLICVLAQERRRRDLRRLAVEADRKGRHPQIAIRVMLRLDDAAAFKGRLGEETAGIHDGAGRDAGGAEDLHRLVLCVVLRPR